MVHFLLFLLLHLVDMAYIYLLLLHYNFLLHMLYMLLQKLLLY